MNKAAHEKITKARTALLIDAPFFGTLAMRLELVQNPDIPTARVDGKVFEYNPDFIMKKENDGDITKSIVAHEVMHCVLEHCGAGGRGINLNPEKWNWACDYVDNDMLVQAGMKLGEGWLHDVQFRGKTAEQIYTMIPDPPPNNGGAPGKGNPGPLDQLKKGVADPAMQQAQAHEWRVATNQAAAAAKAAGKLHESMEKFIEKMNQPKVDWREQLREFITRVAKNDFSWARPNRKMLAQGFWLPGLYSEEMGPLDIASDESGSVSDKIVAAFAAEITAIKEDLRPEKIRLHHFAVEVAKTEEIGPDEPFEMRRFADGGTDFRPVMRKAEHSTPLPCAMVYLTDLEGPFPKDPPPFPVLWVSTTKLTAPFGETIHITLDEQ